MSDTGSDAKSISSNAHSDGDAHGDDEALISGAVRNICNLLRANHPELLAFDSVFIPSYHMEGYSEAEYIEIFQALKEHTHVKNIRFWLHDFTKNYAEAVAEYLESSHTLQTLDIWFDAVERSQEILAAVSVVLRALSRNMSVTKLDIHHSVVGFASVAFQDLLTRTETLYKLEIFGARHQEFDEVQIAAIISGFANNTTLRDLELSGWGEADLVPVLTALQDHPALQKIHFSAESSRYLPSLSGLEVLLRSPDSKVKELILEKVDTHTVVFHPVMQELGRNITVTKLTIRKCVLSRENVQQLKAALRQNTALQYLDLTWSALGSAGLAEIAPVLYRNTSIKALGLSYNVLSDIESANVLRELIRRNKTITSLCVAHNAFGGNVAAAWSILEGVRSNTSLQQLDFAGCGLDNRGVSILANALVTRNASMLELDLTCNAITSVGVRALVDDNVDAVKTLTKLCLRENPVGSEGAIILADALGRNAMPSLKRLDLSVCHIDDDGFVALVSALEQNTSLQIIDFNYNDIGERSVMALAEILPNIKGLQQISITTIAGFESTTLPFLLEGFRENTSLVEVGIRTIDGCEPGWSQELKCLGKRNRFTPLLKASDPPTSPRLGIWSLALAKVATEPDVLFHVLRNKPKLVGSAGGLQKRKRDDE
jgi:Ran GTPase-activating protein (RanGAP) involved in mRNA processing and transport